MRRQACCILSRPGARSRRVGTRPSNTAGARPCAPTKRKTWTRISVSLSRHVGISSRQVGTQQLKQAGTAARVSSPQARRAPTRRWQMDATKRVPPKQGAEGDRSEMDANKRVPPQQGTKKVSEGSRAGKRRKKARVARGEIRYTISESRMLGRVVEWQTQGI